MAGSITPTLAISVGRGTRGPTSAVKTSSNATSREPGSAVRAWVSSSSQRRAAPMPRVSEDVMDRLWRVPKAASRSTVRRSREDSTWPTISST